MGHEAMAGIALTKRTPAFCGSEGRGVGTPYVFSEGTAVLAQCHYDFGSHPGGMPDNSPTFQFQRWDQRPTGEKSRRDGWNRALGLNHWGRQSSLRDLSFQGRIPTLKTLGYCRVSLRDIAFGRYYEEAKGHIDAVAVECHACRKAKKQGMKKKL